ncbi:hypothetical protein GCM10018987_45970 [Streptomyces cremeus]
MGHPVVRRTRDARDVAQPTAGRGGSPCPGLPRAATMLGVRGTFRAARHLRSFNQERAGPCRAAVPGDGALPAEGGAAEEALAAQMSEGYA